MSKEIKDYLHLYLGCELERGGRVTGALLDAANEAAFNAWEDCRPILRPLTDMTEEEVLELCKVASPEIFGDYRFSKWIVERSPHEYCHWTVSNKNSLDYFNISSVDGDVDIYGKDGEFDPTNIDSNYRFWYLKKGFDIFDLILEGLAIDKTTLTPKS